MKPTKPTAGDRQKAIDRQAWNIVRRGLWWAITPRGLPLPCPSWREAVARAAWHRPTWTHQTQTH